MLVGFFMITMIMIITIIIMIIMIVLIGLWGLKKQKLSPQLREHFTDSRVYM